jgi:hypothetical protein
MDEAVRGGAQASLPSAAVTRISSDATSTRVGFVVQVPEFQSMSVMTMSVRSYT